MNAEKLPEMTARDYEELRRAANIAYRVAVIRKSSTMHAVADLLMGQLTDGSPVPGKPAPELERLAELEAFVAKLHAPELANDDRYLEQVGLTVGEIRKVKR